jgi:serine/threonine protein kinase
MIHLPAEGELLAGKYRVERVIGRGGMGVVFAAWHLELDQYVALKFLLTELAERGEAAARFRREARAAAKIKSEHVARVLDVGNFDGSVPYIVMEMLEGCDLAEELRSRGPLPVQETVDYLLQALEAVAEAHSLGIVHRDLKPENLFLSRRSDGSRSVKVLDFGISKLMVLGSPNERSLTQTSSIMGSPLYMSPEQMRAPRDVDGRSDIWSLGAIFYELLSGRPPFIADTIPQLCAMLVEATPTPLRELRPDVPEELERVVSRCLEKPLALRWASIGELARALLPFASSASYAHAERLGRMSGPDYARSPGQGTMQSPLMQTPDPSRATPGARLTPGLPTPVGARTPGGKQVAATPISTLPAPAEAEDPAHRTHRAWGQTHAPGRDAKKWSWVAAVLVLLIGGAGVLYASRRAPEPTRDVASADSTSVGEAANSPEPGNPSLALSAAAATATATEIAAPPAPSSSAAAETNVPAARAATIPPAPPRDTRPSIKSSERPATPAKDQATGAPATAARPKAPGDVGLTDFGGRR